MALGKRLINTGGAAACLTETTDIFGDSSGVALYSLDYDASDAGGLYDGTPTNVDFGVDGQINYGARFNGSSSRIVTGVTPATGSGQFSVSGWVNVDSLSVISGVFSTTTNSGTDRKGFSVHILTSGIVRVLVYDSAGSDVIESTDLITVGNWHHIAITYNNGLTKLYVDGNVQTDTVNQLITGYHDSINIGRYFASVTANTMLGKIDQVRIFSKALSSDEVDTLFAEEACVHTSTTDIVNYPTGTTPVAYYKLDNSSEDYSTGGNDGTDTNIEYRFGRFGQAAVFNGSSSFISSSNILDTSAAFSYSLWIKPNTIGVYDYLIGHQQAGSPYAGVGLIGTTSNIFSIALAGGAPQAMTPSLTLNNWTHLVLTHDGSGNYTCYTNDNGSPITYSGATSNNSSNPFRLGFSSVSGWGYYDGSIDQVRIYDAALTSSQITELYNEKPEVDTSNFKTVLYEGNDATSHFISNVGYDLDAENGGDGGLVWVKNRTGANSHILVDSIRGANNLLFSDATSAALTSNTTLLSSLEKTGFFVGYDGTDVTNGDANSYVAWVWKGGGDAVAGSGSGVTNVSKSVNADAGFSIVEYTGGGSASNTVEHGFDNQTPELIIVKCISDAAFWCVWSSKLTSNYNLALNLTNAQFAANSGSNGGLGDATSSDITFVSGSVNLNTVNGSGRDYIAYCFHSVSGYSKIGSYTGNSSTQTIVTGFEPSFVMIKTINTVSNWVIFDNKRPNEYLMPSLSNAGSSSTDMVTGFVSNGFTLGADASTAAVNSSAANYIYMAFK